MARPGLRLDERDAIDAPDDGLDVGIDTARLSGKRDMRGIGLALARETERDETIPEITLE